MLAREGGFEVALGDQSVLGFQQGRWGLVAGVRGGSGERQRAAFHVLNLFDAAAGIGDDFHFVAEAAVGARHHGERHEAGAIDRQRVGAGVKPGHMQAAGAHGFKLRGVGLHWEELHLLAGHFFHVFEKVFPDLGVDGRVFDWGIGEDQHVGIDPRLGIGRGIGHQIAVGVGVARVHGVGGDADQQRQDEQQGLAPKIPDTHGATSVIVKK